MLEQENQSLASILPTDPAGRDAVVSKPATLPSQPRTPSKSERSQGSTTFAATQSSITQISSQQLRITRDDHQDTLNATKKTEQAENDSVQKIHLSRSQCVRFGRAHPDNDQEDQEARVIYHKLPGDARHISRTHADVVYSPAKNAYGSSFRIRVLGQNGLRLRREDGGMTERYLAGDDVRVRRVGQGFALEDGTSLSAQGLAINFHDCSVSLLWPEKPAEVLTSGEPRVSKKAKLDSPFAASSPPPKMAEVPSYSRVGTLIRESSLPYEPSSESELTPSSPVATSTHLEASKAGIDLIQSIVTALVFSGTALTSLESVCAGIKQTVPATANIRDLDDQVQDLLTTQSMFGVVSRVGKDAGGKAIPDSYYYIPASDPDVQRANSLGPLVKAPRKTQLQNKTYFYKKPTIRKIKK